MLRRIHRVLLAAVTATVAACGGTQDETTPITLQLKWLHQAQFAGVYVAQDHKLFAQAKLQVDVKPGGPAIIPLDELIQGRADFALVSPEDLIVARNKGEPVIAVAAIFRRNPLVFISRPDNPVRLPKDLAGKRVSFAGVDGRIQLEALMRRHGVAHESITVVPYELDYSSLLGGTTDVSSAYLTSGLLRLAARGHEMEVLWPEDFDVHFYGDILATTDRFLAERPEVTRRFVTAILSGWETVLSNPEEAIRLTLAQQRGADEALQRAMLSRTFAMVHTGRDRIGTMRAEDWHKMEQYLIDAGIIRAPQSPTQYFTLSALEGP